MRSKVIAGIIPTVLAVSATHYWSGDKDFLSRPAQLELCGTLSFYNTLIR
jgi:hypothetical protein